MVISFAGIRNGIGDKTKYYLTKRTKMSAKIPQATMTLKQFMLRQQVLKLYRSLLRAIRGITDEESKNEVLQWVRTDFRNNKHHTDEYVIKMLIYHGERQLKQLQQNLAFSR